MPSAVCVDASLAAKLALPEEYADKARALWEEWERRGVERLVPTLWGYEIAAVVRKYGHRQWLTPEEEEETLRLLLNLPVRVVDMWPWHHKAGALARELGLSTSYDAHYLLLSRELGVAFWTGDRRLYNTVRKQVDFVRWIGA